MSHLIGLEERPIPAPLVEQQKSRSSAESIEVAGTFEAKMAVAYLLVAASTLFAVLLRLHGGFSYSLDDGYIHLALAQQILHLHYGINPGEPSSPSSSLLWPFLLAPFSRLPLHTWVPLVFDLGFGLAFCVLLGRLVERMRLLRRVTLPPLQWLAAFALVVCSNLVGLTFLGMEHTLQVFLVTGCLWGLYEAYEGREIPTWVLWMAALAPAVRYENLAFTLAVCLACAAQGRWRAGAGTFAGSLLPLLLFSLFLHALGLPALPTSVLVKGGVAGAPAGGAVSKLFQVGWKELRTTHEGQGVTLTPGLIVLAAGFWLTRTSPVQRKVLLCATVAIGLLYLFGPYGWFFRYDTAFRMFLLVICLLILRERGWVAAVISLLLLAGWISYYIVPTVYTIDGCTQIYRQQAQMHHFEHDLWRRSVAVDDLGWVSLDHPPGAYVLDLDGLASPEAAMTLWKDATWLRSEVQAHHVGLAMVYTGKFLSIPSEWVYLGSLKQVPLSYSVIGGKQVDFYATSSADVPELKRDLTVFREELPQGAWFDGGPPMPVCCLRPVR